MVVVALEGVVVVLAGEVSSSHASQEVTSSILGGDVRRISSVCDCSVKHAHISCGGELLIIRYKGFSISPTLRSI